MADRVLSPAPTRRTLLAGAAVAPIAASAAVASAAQANAVRGELSDLVDRWFTLDAELANIEHALEALSVSLDARDLTGGVLVGGRRCFDRDEVCEAYRVSLDLFGISARRQRALAELAEAQQARERAWIAEGGDTLEARWTDVNQAAEDLLTSIRAAPIETLTDAVAVLRLVARFASSDGISVDLPRVTAALVCLDR